MSRCCRGRSWSGSSPLTRGKHARAALHAVRRGLIPAHAGKTPSSCNPIPRVAAHPRSRGENAKYTLCRGMNGGSSPLTRGKPAWTRCPRPCRRLIPAHAGKTFRRKVGFFDWPAHPRSRGENSPFRGSRVLYAGSSPLTRGKLVVISVFYIQDGLIPAHAGKTGFQRRASMIRGAHPRSRGENPTAYTPVGAVTGSSPLTRGKQNMLAGERGHGRLIPAHAGKTVDDSPEVIEAQAHPRSRGENVLPRLPSADFAGSSPLTRGKLQAIVPIIASVRLIPAHAGKTSPWAAVRAS